MQILVGLLLLQAGVSFFFFLLFFQLDLSAILNTHWLTHLHINIYLSTLSVTMHNRGALLSECVV